MFKPHYAVCRCHGVEQLIVVKAGYCKRGNEELKAFKKHHDDSKIVVKKFKKKIVWKKSTGELDLYKEIWNERPHASEVNGEKIETFNIWCFSHILPKGLYPRYRMKKENIIIKTSQQHYDWGNNRHKLKELPEWKPIFELYDKLKQQYNEEFKNK